jgi:hypothetical protein
MIVELEGPLFARVTYQDMDAIKYLLKTTSSTIWLTNGGLLKGKKPEHSLIFGIAKSIMTEQLSIRISSIDLAPDERNHSRSAEIILQHELSFREDHGRVLDTEFIEHNGVVRLSRYVLDPVENRDFARQLKPSPETL